jgi:catechol 2,3-dioxygenase-like lactoylglutathione lyase family enzyme
MSSSFTPRLNHVAMTVDRAIIDEKGRKEILDFYGEVFGWTEGDNTGETGNPLILYTGTFAQFVYLLPGDPFLTAPRLDHFGLQLATRDELSAHVERVPGRSRRRTTGSRSSTSRAGRHRGQPTTTRSRAPMSGFYFRSWSSSSIWSDRSTSTRQNDGVQLQVSLVLLPHQLTPGSDPFFSVDRLQMVLDGPGCDIELFCDL